MQMFFLFISSRSVCYLTVAKRDEIAFDIKKYLLVLISYDIPTNS